MKSTNGEERGTKKAWENMIWDTKNGMWIRKTNAASRGSFRKEDSEIEELILAQTTSSFASQSEPDLLSKVDSVPKNIELEKYIASTTSSEKKNTWKGMKWDPINAVWIKEKQKEKMPVDYIEINLVPEMPENQTSSRRNVWKGKKWDAKNQLWITETKMASTPLWENDS